MLFHSATPASTYDSRSIYQPRRTESVPGSHCHREAIRHKQLGVALFDEQDLAWPGASVARDAGPY
jgi:hypothetical protein